MAPFPALSQICGATLPARITSNLAKATSDGVAVARFGKFRERRTPTNRRRYRPIRRDHPELDDLFDDEEDDFELVPCVCGEKQ